MYPIFCLTTSAGDSQAYRDFAAAIDTSIAFVSYVLNAQSVKIRNKVIAGIIDAAAAGSGVTLETLMEAQGRIHKKDLESFERNYQGEIRRILIDELLEAGYEIKFSEYYKAEPNPTNSSFVLELKQPDTDCFVSCDFKIKACPLVKDTDDIDALISSWLDKTISVNFFHKIRLFLAVDNSTVYREIQKKVEDIRIPNDISILLVSPQKRKIINEYMVPRSDEKKTTPLVPHYESKEDWTSCYPIRQIYIKDARSLIADKLMEKDCLIRLIDAGSFQPPDMIGHIQPDFTLAVNRFRRKPFHWAFTLLPLPEDANETAVREEIRAWISKAIVYYYLGGKLDRISLIVDDEQIYSY